MQYVHTFNLNICRMCLFVVDQNKIHDKLQPNLILHAAFVSDILSLFYHKG